MTDSGRRQFTVVEILIEGRWVRVCSICEKPVNGRGGNGWCNLHYTRWLKHGDPTIVKPRGIGIRGLPPEQRAAAYKRAGFLGGTAKAQRGPHARYWCNWLIAEVSASVGRNHG